MDRTSLIIFYLNYYYQIYVSFMYSVVLCLCCVVFVRSLLHSILLWDVERKQHFKCIRKAEYTWCEGVFLLRCVCVWRERKRSNLFDHIVIQVPVGVAVFPVELLPPFRRWASYFYVDIIQWTNMPRGGHFAALEQPLLLSKDIWDFLEKVERNSGPTNKKMDLWCFSWMS